MKAKWLRRLGRRLLGIPELTLEEMPDAPGLFRQYRALLDSGHQRVPGGWMYDGEFYPDYLTVGGASFAIQRTALKWCKGRGVDIGAGLWPLPGATPIDVEAGPGVSNSLEKIAEGSLDFVFSSHCLEHIADWRPALRAWVGKLHKGGVVFLYLPHPTCKLWLPSNPAMTAHHKWSPTPEIIKQAFAELGLSVVDCDDGPDHFYSFYVCGRL
jgi:SAM-dependent methyltransferase